MSILNYFFIGFVFTFLMDILINIFKSKGLIPKNIEWGWLNRSLCIVIWPLAAIWFLIAFFKAVFKI